MTRESEIDVKNRPLSWYWLSIYSARDISHYYDGNVTAAAYQFYSGILYLDHGYFIYRSYLT